jgi:hypothetical protein
LTRHIRETHSGVFNQILMLAFLFTITLFLYLGVIGLSVISLFSARLRILQQILVSPAIGLAAIILPTFLLSRAGLPVKAFGGWLVLISGVLSLAVLFIRRPILPLRQLLWCGLILLGALLLASRPMLSYGFDWVSFANDDMANYSLGAQRFLQHGYFDTPDWEALLSGRDYSLAFWFMHVPAATRAGSELMLAVVWAVSGLTAHQVFMPVIFALHLALISATGAMVA